MQGIADQIVKLRKVKELPLMALGLIAASLLDGSKKLSQLLPSDLFYLLLIAAGIVLLYFWNKHSEPKVLPSGKSTENFFPFLASLKGEDVTRFLISREEIGKPLYQIIQEENNRHIAVVGDSGTGKSTLLADYTFPKAVIPIRVVEYDDGAVAAICKQLKQKSTELDDESKGQVESVIAFLLNSKGSDEQLPARVAGMLDLLSTKSTLYVLFDQAERLVAASEVEDIQREANQEVLAILMQEFRLCANIRTIFSIRSEFAAATVAELVRLEGLKENEDPCEVLRYFPYAGIDPNKEKGAYSDIIIKYTDLSRGGTASSLVSRISDSKGKINPFKMQLFGYMGEAFQRDDRWVQAFFRGEDVPDSDIYDRLWHYAAGEYDANAEGWKSGRSLFIVLYTISAYNEAYGDAITASKIATFCALPVEIVESAVKFLESKGLLVPAERKLHGVEQFRVVHDLIRDYALSMANPSVRSAYRDAVKNLVERPVLRAAWAPPAMGMTFGARLIDFKNLNCQLFIIGLMMVVCLARLFAPDAIYPYFETGYVFLGKVVSNLTPTVVASFMHTLGLSVPIIKTSSLEYLAIMIPQFLFVVFMFQLNEYCFENLSRKNAGLAARLARWAAPVGAILGGATLFLPSLFMISIVVGGTMLAVAFLIGSKNESIPGLAGDTASELGWKTFGNQVVGAGLTVILCNLYTHDEVFARGATLFLAGGLAYFHYMLTPRLGTVEAWAELLAQARIPRAR